MSGRKRQRPSPDVRGCEVSVPHASTGKCTQATCLHLGRRVPEQCGEDGTGQSERSSRDSECTHVPGRILNLVTRMKPPQRFVDAPGSHSDENAHRGEAEPTGDYDPLRQLAQGSVVRLSERLAMPGAYCGVHIAVQALSARDIHPRGKPAGGGVSLPRAKGLVSTPGQHPPMSPEAQSASRADTGQRPCPGRRRQLQPTADPPRYPQNR